MLTHLQLMQAPRFGMWGGGKNPPKKPNVPPLNLAPVGPNDTFGQEGALGGPTGDDYLDQALNYLSKEDPQLAAWLASRVKPNSDDIDYTLIDQCSNYMQHMGLKGENPIHKFYENLDDD